MTVTLGEHCSAHPPVPYSFLGHSPWPVWLYASFTSQELWFDFCLPLPGALPLYLVSRRREGHGGPEVQTDLAQVTRLHSGGRLSWKPAPPAAPRLPRPLPAPAHRDAPFGSPKANGANQRQDCETLWCLPLPRSHLNSNQNVYKARLFIFQHRPRAKVR